MEDSKYIYDITPRSNYITENFKGNLKEYIKSKEKKYLLYNEFSDIDSSSKNFAISENLSESNYYKNLKMSYDLNIDSIGNAISNVNYPEEKKGGYKFKLTLEDNAMLHQIISKSSKIMINQDLYTSNNHNSVAIIIDGKVITNSLKIKSNLDLSALIMFSNIITLKYINNMKPSEKLYDIKTSRYTKSLSPTPLSIEKK